MFLIDAPPPAIVVPRPVQEIRFVLNGDDYGSILPRDFASMPAVLRSTVTVAELRPYLPPAFRLLSNDMLADVLYANLPGLPGALMAGGDRRVKTAVLLTTAGSVQEWTRLADWYRFDNAIHAVGRGGTGGTGLNDGSFSRSGGGGGGSAWAANFNRSLPRGVYNYFVATALNTDTWFRATDWLLADSAGNGSPGTVVGAPGGSRGEASNSVGDAKNNGGTGGSGFGFALSPAGGGGAGAGGPNGAGNNGGNGSANVGGAGGLGDAGLGAGGWNPGGDPNAQSGTGGAGAEGSGQPGSPYGSGGGGGGLFPGGSGAQGCILIINNVSL